MACSRVNFTFTFYTHYKGTNCDIVASVVLLTTWKYEGWNFNSGNYLFTTDTK